VSNRAPSHLDHHQKAFISLLKNNAHRHRPHEVFRDFCELSAIAISNAVDPLQYDAREARYLQIVKGYSKEEINRFPAMLAHVVNALETGFADVLGSLFMALELGNHWKGQFFTPYEVSRLMAMMTMTDASAVVERQGFVSVHEPAAGAGAMVLACAHALQDQGVNYQQSMHATAIDIDATAVHMCYIQLSLMHIPAIVVHGNALTVEEWGHWVTPAHVLGFWDHRWRRRYRAAAADDAAPFPAPIITEPQFVTDDARPAAPIIPTVDLATVSAIVEKRIAGGQQLSLFS